MPPASPNDARDREPADETLVDLTPSPLITELSTKEEQPARTIELLGYFGEPDASGLLRLYLNLDLRSYYRISKDDIVFAQGTNKADPSQPTKVLVAATAKIEFVVTLEASFLEGTIANAHAGPIPGPAVKSLLFGFADQPCKPIVSFEGLVRSQPPPPPLP